ncbi:AAA domain-containing protein [Flectobacillus roseus]|uniref:AAA domain-containing protein n=1 Tax=Flectobacillus roseus TaxID=502259 RepID=UPI0024B72E6F|nr:AAA domain-containing protein [Flectobacillus roseus]MDI9871509.1 AAA domain-containing protein [Flectobacillus roseus]
MSYFENLTSLLQIEREEDRTQYKQLTESTSVSERRANGLTWYPVAIRGTELTKGDYISVELERTTHHDLAHVFRFGVPATLFSNHNPSDDRIEGLVSYQGGNRLKLSLKTDELPDWSRDGKLGVDVLFDENSYDEMFAALKVAQVHLNDSNSPKAHLIKVLTGQTKPTFDEYIQAKSSPKLNEFQNKALTKILQAQDLAIVHGPPGTGKTTTLVEAIQQLAQKDQAPILVVAPSNAAVDLLSEKLSLAGLNVLRVGNPARVSDALMTLTLDAKMTEHPAIKEIKRFKKQAQEFKSMAHKYKRNFGKAERDQRKLLFEEAHKIMKEVERTEQYMIDDILTKTQIVTATMVGANHYTVRKLQYKTVVIDEAGQALEPACWIAILKAQRVILAGDHCQLAPTIKSNEASQKGLSKTLLEKSVEAHPESVVLLQEQYRMNELIMGYSSQVFYQNLLKAHESVAQRTLFDGEIALNFVDTAGCGFEEKLIGTSTINPEEAQLLVKHLTQLIENYKVEKPDSAAPSIAVISPYKQQVLELQQLVQHSGIEEKFLKRISVNTIDSFQGQERDIVYISMVRNNAEGEIGFLSDIRRMNVAMTRAKKKLVVIGDSATLAQFDFYAKFIEYAENTGSYLSAWEFM